jgi:hypothetical protein
MGASLLMERTMEINEKVNPLEDPKQREIIDEILNKNKTSPVQQWLFLIPSRRCLNQELKKLA